MHFLGMGNLVPPDIRNEIAESVVFIRTYGNALRTLNVEITTLVSLEILPATIAWSRVEEARSRLQQASQTQIHQQFSEDRGVVQSLVSAIRDRSEGIAIILGLGMRIVQHTGQDLAAALPAVLSVLARYVDYRNVADPRSGTEQNARDSLAQYLVLPPGFWNMFPARFPDPDSANGLTAWCDAVIRLRSDIENLPTAELLPAEPRRFGRHGRSV